MDEFKAPTVKRLYGLIGTPLGHSYSRTYFNDFFMRENLDCEYRNFELEDIGEVVELVAEEPALMGFNVTSPYKQQILPYLSHLSEDAAKASAVNTVKIFRNSHIGDFQLYGYNTDIGGLKRSLEPVLANGKGRALIFGTGGASNAAQIALESMGYEGWRVSRHPADGMFSYDEVTKELLGGISVLVNATPLGMHPNEQKCVPIDYSGINSDCLCLDMVYNPSLTMFMKECAKAGATVKNGFSMLLHQAELSWEIWNDDEQ